MGLGEGTQFGREVARRRGRMDDERDLRREQRVQGHQNRQPHRPQRYRKQVGEGPSFQGEQGIADYEGCSRIGARPPLG